MSSDSLDLVQARVDALLDKDSLTSSEREYLNELGNQVIELEEGVDIPDIYGLELLKVLMEDNSVLPSELVYVLGPLPYVESILSGECELSNKDIEALSKFFHVDPPVFLPK